MALDRRARGRADTKEERSLFPVWTLIVILGCACLWLGGAKIYQDQMAAYESYAAIRQTVSSDVFFPGVTVDGTDLGGMSVEEAQQLVSGSNTLSFELPQEDQYFMILFTSGEAQHLSMPMPEIVREK